jgi:queuine/archaeosine tRNA-ribosyltransferase
VYFLPQRLLTPTREQVDAARFEEATHRTTRWIDRCIAAHGRPTEQVPPSLLSPLPSRSLSLSPSLTLSLSLSPSLSLSLPLSPSLSLFLSLSQALFGIVQGGLDVRLRAVRTSQKQNLNA